MTYDKTVMKIITLFLDLLDKCSVIVKRILEKEAKGWYIKYKDKLLTELKGETITNLVQGGPPLQPIPCNVVLFEIVRT